MQHSLSKEAVFHVFVTVLSCVTCPPAPLVVLLLLCGSIPVRLWLFHISPVFVWTCQWHCMLGLRGEPCPCDSLQWQCAFPFTCQLLTLWGSIPFSCSIQGQCGALQTCFLHHRCVCGMGDCLKYFAWGLVAEKISSQAQTSNVWLLNAVYGIQNAKDVRAFFLLDFDFSVPGSMKLHNLISKLKKWIKILEAKTKQLPKFFLIEEKCRFLSNFSAQTAEVEIPGEFLMPKPTHYYIKIAR